MTSVFRKMKSRAFGTDLTGQLLNCQPKTKAEGKYLHQEENSNANVTKKPILKRLFNGLSDKDVAFPSPKKSQQKPSFKRQNGISIRVDCSELPVPSVHQSQSQKLPLLNSSHTKPSIKQTQSQKLPQHLLSVSPAGNVFSPASPLDNRLGPEQYPETPYLHHSLSLSILNEMSGCHYIRNRSKTSTPREGEHYISKRDREVLIDWMMSICNKFELSESTVYLSVNIFDRYLASLHGKIQGDRQLTFQRIACATMWIASKYHDVYAPEPDDFAVLTANAVSKDQLIKMELAILIAINFELTIETPLSFIPRFNDIGCAYIDRKNDKNAKTQKKELHSMMMYCLEICSLDYKLSLEKPSKVAAAILYYCCIGTNIFSWNQFKDDNGLKFVNDYRVNDVLFIMKKMHRICIKIEKEKKSRIYEKYSSKEENRVTQIAKSMHLSSC